jgi:hypothetical protein
MATGTNTSTASYDALLRPLGVLLQRTGNGTAPFSSQWTYDNVRTVASRP